MEDNGNKYYDYVKLDGMLEYADITIAIPKNAKTYGMGNYQVRVHQSGDIWVVHLLIKDIKNNEFIVGYSFELHSEPSTEVIYKLLKDLCGKDVQYNEENFQN